MTEATVQKQIVDYLKARGHTVVRINSGGIKLRSSQYVHLAEPGTPDLLSIDRRGNHVWIEVKRQGGDLRKDQIEWIAEHRTRGCTVLVAQSLDDVTEHVK